ncbi:hypothetical protein N9Y89_01640 [bacterium]|nr:hypothetical protein [bacterium]
MYYNQQKISFIIDFCNFVITIALFYFSCHIARGGTLELIGSPEGLEFDVVLEDVETLNRMALERQLDITKLSFNAFLHALSCFSE